MADDLGTSTPATFADRLNYLFATRLAPSGKPWTLQAISVATGGKIPVPYLSMLRKGKIAAPAWDRVQMLADIFGVAPNYFSDGQALPENFQPSSVDLALQRALTRPSIRPIVLRAGAYGERQLALLLELMDQVEKITEAEERADHVITRIAHSRNQHQAGSTEESE